MTDSEPDAAPEIQIEIKDDPKARSDSVEEIKGHSIRPATLIKCPLCLDEKTEEDLYRLQACGHLSCPECLSAYLRAHLKDQSKYPLKCFVAECKINLDYTDVRSHLTEEEVAVYDKFLIRVALLSDKSHRPLYCPLPDCDTMMIVEESDLQEPLKVCTGCTREFCCKCLIRWHKDKTCEEVKEADREGEALRAANLAMFQQLAKKENWLPCPTCGFMIERTGGCHHMSHFRSQGCHTMEEATHFCSLCSLVLGGKYHKDEPDGTLHFPEGLFKACRVAAKLIAEGKMAPLPVVDSDIPPGAEHDPLQGRANLGLPDLGRSWTISLCGCLSDPSDWCTCFKGCCCPCYVAGETEDMLPILGGGGGKWKTCLRYFCCWPCVAPYKRRALRRLFDIKGYCCFDCCVSNLCPCCAVIQERGELLRRAGPDVQVMA